MNNHGNPLEIETNDFVFIRKDLKRIIDTSIEEESKGFHERKDKKAEMDQWLNRLFSSLPGCVSLVDNPNFNFADPVTAERPFNEALADQVQQAKRELEAATEEVVQKRERATQILTEVETYIVDAETEETLLETTMKSVQPQRHIERIHRHDKKLIESDFDEAVKMLVGLDETVASNISKFNSISDVLDSNKF